MAGSQVKVARPALQRAFARSDFQFVWMQLRLPKPSTKTGARAVDVAAVGDAIAAAMDEANESFNTEAWADEYVYVGWSGWLPGGPALYTKRMPSPAALDTWLDAFAAGLSARGIAGELRPAPKADYPEWANQMGTLQLTALVAYTLEDPRPAGYPLYWNVPADVTERVTDLYGHAFPGSRALLQTGGGALQIGTDCAEAITDRLASDHMAQFYFIRDEPRRFVNNGMYVNGLVNRMVYDPGQSWQGLLTQAVDTLTALPADTMLGFAQYGLPLRVGWDAAEYGRPPMRPGVGEPTWRYTPWILHDQVPDPRGVMVLTDAHLARAHDLSGWQLEHLGHGRHLLQAPDLAAWFAQPDPDPDVLARARADFGDMLLTPERCKAAEAEAPPVDWSLYDCRPGDGNE